MIQDTNSFTQIIEFKDPNPKRLSCLTPLFFMGNYPNPRRLKSKLLDGIDETRLGSPCFHASFSTALQFQYLNIQKNL